MSCFERYGGECHGLHLHVWIRPDRSQRHGNWRRLRDGHRADRRTHRQCNVQRAVGLHRQLFTECGRLRPVDARLWFSQFENSFTVQNGVITSAVFHADNDFSASLDRLYINVPIYGAGGTNYASVGSNNSTSVWNNQGLFGITFTRIDTAVPEPATWMMMLIGFGAIGFAARRSRVRALGLA
ncbi:PEP-CTERM sorting domain-containing protein [Sphingomonas daechungensis]|uniref:PEP-CTERM sorting domain-containing protein n=1 Tax=Sphingomonas daechungensis TaxID=1176646 RepID=A0ABX6T073_9SPHN|nr:PEP-CTERM sorting domain-containing protein [Sphingomonas daechungensis]